jgi:ATP-binding cassette subfamily C protein
MTTDADTYRLPTATPRAARRAVVALAAEHPLLTGGVVLTQLAAAGCLLLVPLLLGRIVDIVLAHGTAGSLGRAALALIAATVAQSAFTGVNGQLTAHLGETILASFRELAVTRALAIPMARLERAGSGDLVSRVGGDVAVISQAVRAVVPEFATALATAGLTVVGLALLDWRLAVAALPAIPIQIAGLRGYLRGAVPVFRRERVLEGERTQTLVGAISGARTVRALGLTDARLGDIDSSSRSTVECSRQAVRLLSDRFFPALNFAELVGLSCVVTMGFVLVRADTITVGVAAAAALYFHRAFDPVAALLLLANDLQEATAALSRIVGVTTLDASPPPAAIPDVGDGSISVVGVDYAYVEGRRVLADINLEVEDGERVALIGSTGAGKTTLAQLIAGIHSPTAGTVSIRGVPVAAFGASATREHVALITQEAHVFAGTLASDLRLAAPHATDEELVDALRQVGAEPWLDALPEGIGTVVGDGALQLSATQAQQVALARLLLRDPPIVILDEATADAGSAGARTLEKAAEQALRGRTAIVVAHRLTQATTADRIVVLEAGQIVEHGPHDELVAIDGRYASLWGAWSASRVVDDV